MYKFLLGYVGDYKKPSILASLAMMIEVLFELSIPFLMAAIIDKGINRGDLNSILFYGAIMLVCAIFSLLLGRASSKFAGLASAGLAKNLRKALFEKIQDFSFENIDRFSSASLVTRMMTDVTNVQNAYQMIIRVCVRAPLNLIVAISIAFFINKEIASIFIYVALFLGFVLAVVLHFAHPTFQKVFRAYDGLNAAIQENITNIRVVKSYVKEEHEIQKFTKETQGIYNLFMKAIRVVLVNSPAMMLSMYASIIGISWLGARLIVANQFTTGELTSMFSYTMTILMSLMMFTMIFVMLSLSIASVERIVEVLQTESSIHSPEHAVTEVKDGAIEFNHVNFGYQSVDDATTVLTDINLSIKPGEMIGIIGGTGSGKSSLIQLLPRMYDVQSGEVKVGGVNVKDYDLEILRKEVAMVLQTNTLFSGTISENLRWGNKDATMEELIAACKIAEAHGFISEFENGYDTMVERGGANLSGGQRQRLCIARALLTNPKVLILDDSTSAVDTKTDAHIRQGLAEHLDGVTTLIISQRISSIQDADRIIVLEDGRVSGFASHDELLQTNATYQEIYRTQTKGGDADA